MKISHINNFHELLKNSVTRDYLRNNDYTKIFDTEEDPIEIDRYFLLEEKFFFIVEIDKRHSDVIEQKL